MEVNQMNHMSIDDLELCIKKSETILFLLNTLIKNPSFNIKINLVTNLSLTSFFIKEILKIFIKMKLDSFVKNKNVFKLDVLVLYLKLIRLKSYIKESFDKTNINKHIRKIFRYDRNGNKRNYIFVCCKNIFKLNP